MTRISRIVNETIMYPTEINSWVDVGTGNGQVVKALSWEPFVRNKLYYEVEDVENCLGPSWNRIPIVDLVKRKPDLVTLFDVIEHFDKEEGIEYLDYVVEYSSHSIIFTPEGFFPQEGTQDNPHMEHKSGWEAEEFEERGYKVLVLKDFHFHAGLGRPFNAILAWR